MSDAEYRAQFPVTQEWAFLNHAAVAPLSRPAHDRILEWAHDFAYHGNVREADWYREIERVRQTAADYVHAEPREVAFLKNTSEGLSLVAEGLNLRPGESVVTVSGEFPANVYPWLHLETKDVTVRQVAPVERGRIRLEDLAAAIDDTTRLLSISFVQYASGFRSDLAAIGRLCRERNVLFCVDAIQGLGVFPVDVGAMHIDFLAADGHKWLLAPEGAAIFYCRHELLERLRPTSVGWKSVAGCTDYAKIDFRFPDAASRFECGSMNVPGIVGLGASLRLLQQAGGDVIESRVRSLTDDLVRRLEVIGAAVYSPREEGEWSGIVSFDLPGRDPRSVKKHCLERKVVIAYREGRLRASPHFYNNADDLEALTDALASVRGTE
jgi:selenocysteine lyase/cysteine desulfurase